MGRLLVIAAALVLVSGMLAGCGGDDDEGPQEGGTVTALTIPAEPTVEEAASRYLAVVEPSNSELRSLVEQLDETLGDEQFAELLDRIADNYAGAAKKVAQIDFPPAVQPAVDELVAAWGRLAGRYRTAAAAVEQGGGSNAVGEELMVAIAEANARAATVRGRLGLPPPEKLTDE